MDPRIAIWRSVRAQRIPLRWLCGCALLIGSAANLPGQVAPPATSSRDAVELDDAPLRVQEQLVLVVSKATDTLGKRRDVLVFLSRPRNEGWQAIGAKDTGELREHWRAVAQRRLSTAYSLELNDAERRKVEIAVELTISRFMRVYEQLQYELTEGYGTDGRGTDLMSDPRYGVLRDAGVQGLFGKDSLAARVLNAIAARREAP